MRKEEREKLNKNVGKVMFDAFQIFSSRTALLRFTFHFSLFTFLVFTPVFATELNGGVTFDVNSAREYVQDGIPDGVEINQAYVFHKNNGMQKVVYSYNNGGEVIGITVTYKNELDKAYIYGRSKQLIYVDKYDKPIDQYPHRGYRYDLDGNLILTSLTVSQSEMFRFDPNGKLIAHSVFGVIYDENGNVIGRGK